MIQACETGLTRSGKGLPDLLNDIGDGSGAECLFKHSLVGKVTAGRSVAARFNSCKTLGFFPHLTEIDALNVVIPESGVAAVIVPLAAMLPAGAVFEVGTTIFTITADLAVKISAIVPTLQLILTVVAVELTEQGVPVVGVTVHGQLVQATTSDIAVGAVVVDSVPLFIVSVTEMFAP